MAQNTMPPNTGWANDIRRLEDQFVQLKVSLEAFMARTMGRAEIEAEIISRVAQDTYQADQRSINDRLARIENGPQRLIAWLGVASGCLGVIISFLGVSAGVIMWLITQHH